MHQCYEMVDNECIRLRNDRRSSRLSLITNQIKQALLLQLKQGFLLEALMAFPDDVMFDTATVQPLRGNSSFGPVYGDEYDVKCSMEPGYKSVTDSKGNNVVASLSGIFRAECTIKPNDLIAWNSKTYRAVNVAPIPFQGSVHHVEIDFVSVAG